MKTFFKSILAVAVCASLFAACSKDDTVSDPSNGRKVTMTVTASSELESVFTFLLLVRVECEKNNMVTDKKGESCNFFFYLCV